MRFAPEQAARLRPGVRWLAQLNVEVAPYRGTILPLSLVVIPWAVWVGGPGWAWPAFLAVGLAGAALLVIDGRTHRLPNAITLPGIVLVFALLGAAALGCGDARPLQGALFGGVGLGAMYGLLHAASPQGLGAGDVKLAVLLGLPAGWLGWEALWLTALLPFLIGGLAALVLVVTHRATRHTAIAFGPYMLLGWALALTLVKGATP
ncbi:MAG: A24 family peptidase [Promicromonosporaceae bacterium]|nr:A24 family peptidase [Promicromonosporaceae bacterium]